ncbi:MAG: FHA domain-containing protein [Anaerolineae bacterium]|jgi:pSer/pThr/pTyr-binding forkhead associated (FHA) protein
MSEELNQAETPGLRLVVQGTDEEFLVADAPITIGCGAENAVVITDPEVAELHATIRRGDEEEGYLIEDAGSATGTYVNEQRVEGSTPLQEGDAIRVGNTILYLKGDGEAAAEVEPAAPKKAAVSPWLFGGIAVVAVVLLLACIAVFTLAFSGGRDSDEATSEPPVAAATATQAPGEPSATPLLPQVEYFVANPTSIDEGDCTTLQWGEVSGADEVSIDPEIGGVGTPDSIEVCPMETTEYIMTAEGPGGTTEASVTVEVVPGLADLGIESITFDPNPANAQQPCEVAITISNLGNTDASGFDWQWQAGFDATFDGRVDGLAAGETAIVIVEWTPQDGYENLTTEAVVDAANEVPEDDKGNNRLQAEVRVIPMPARPETVELKSQMSLDGFRANNGQGSTEDEILVGNGEVVQPAGELIARGFMSFDISGIPAGATIDNVELRFYQSKVTGDPYGKLVGLVLEQVSYGSSLDDAAYNAPASDSLSLNPLESSGQWYMVADAALVRWVQNDVATDQSQFQVRLRFSLETDGDGLEDWISIHPGGSFLGSSRAPVLVITYLP